MMCMGMAVGMAACSGVPRGPASSFEAAFAGHHSGLAAVSEGGDAAVRPLPRMNAREALEERLPGGVRLASANTVAAADAPMTIPPLDDDEVLEEYDPWEPFNRKMFAFNRQLDRFVLKPVATVWDTVLPDLAQESLGNFFSNLSMPRPPGQSSLPAQHRGCRPGIRRAFSSTSRWACSASSMWPPSWASPRAVRTPVRRWASMVPDLVLT